MSEQFNPFSEEDFEEIENTGQAVKSEYQDFENYTDDEFSAFTEDSELEEIERNGDDFELNDEEFGNIIQAGTYQETVHLDANKDRYGISVLNPISMADSTPYFYLGDFNLKGGKNGTNRKNLSFFPRLKLFPCKTGRVPIPYEGKAAMLDEEAASKEVAAEFDISTLETTLRKSRRYINRTAEQFANQVYERYKKEGFVILHSLDGIENYNEAERCLKIVLTAEKVNEKFPTKVRERFGFELKPPYLPEMIQYLEKHALAEIEKNARNRKDLDRLKLLRVELIKACRIARSYCEKTLSFTEKLIADKNKDGYDLPNLDYANAKPPTDLVCMIHLNRQPQTEKILEVARATADSLAANNRPVATAPAPVYQGIAPEEVVKMLNAQQDDFKKQLDDFRKEFQQNKAETKNPEPPTPQVPKTASNAAKPNNPKQPAK